MTTYCFNVATRRWSTWDLQKEDAESVTDMLCVDGVYAYATYGGTYSMTWGQDASPSADRNAYSDHLYSLTVSAVNGSDSYDFTLAGTSATYVAEVGDVWSRSGTLWIVTSVVDANTVVAVNADGTALESSDSLTAFKAYECELTWRPIGGGSANTKKRFASFEVSAQAMSGVRTATLTYDSDHSSEGTQDKVGSYAATGPRAYRAVVKRPHARARWLKPGIRIKQAGSSFKIDGLQVEYEHMTHKVSR